MPDWKRYVRRNLRLPELIPEREAEIVEELAEQLEAAYYLTWTNGLNLSGYGQPAHPTTGPVSFNLFSVFGVKPFLGRTFNSVEDQPGSDPVVVLEYGFWKRQFGGDPSVVGARVTMSDEEYEILGVMPEGFSFPDESIDMWVPLALDPGLPGPRTSRFYGAVARLRAGTSLEIASQDVARIAAELAAEHPQAYPERQVDTRPAEVWRLQQSETREVRPTLLLLWGAVGLVLLIVGTNVSGLLVLRDTALEKAFAIRAALGARRWRIVRQLWTEYMFLFLAGGIGGLALAAVGLRLGLSLSRFFEGFLYGVGSIDVTTYAVLTLGLSLLAVGACLLPALRATRVDPLRSLRQE